MPKKSLCRSAFAEEEFGAKPAHPRQSWGLQGKRKGSDAVCFFGWLDQVVTRDGRQYIPLLGQWDSNSFGYKERVEHIALAESGACNPYCILSEGEPDADGKRHMTGFIRHVFGVSRLVFREGQTYGELTAIG